MSRRVVAAAVPFVLALHLLAAAPAAHAGIVNVQSAMATEAEEGWSGALTGTIDWHIGNVSYLFLGATPVVRYRAGDHLVIAIVRAERKTSGDLTLASSFFEHLRYRHQVSRWLTGEVFGQHEYDATRRLELRALVGAGPKLDLLRCKQYAVSIGAAYMLEYERLRDDGEDDGGRRDVQHRMSSYLVGRYQVDDRLQMVSTVYAQPRIDEPSDARLLAEHQIVIEVTKRLALTTTLRVAFDSEPPATVQGLDTAVTSSVTWTL